MMKKTFILFAHILCSISMVAQINNDPNLIARYPFDGNGNDISSNGFDATLVGPSGFVPDRNGNPSSAFAFNGVSNYFLVNDVNATFKPNTFPVTISCWVNIPSNFQGQFTFFKNDFAQNIYSGIRGTVIPNGRVTISLENGGPIGAGSRRTKTGTTNIKDNNWHLITCIVRGFNDMDIFIDCSNDGGTYSGGATTLAYSPNNPGIIGAYDGVLGNNNFEYSLGSIDDLIFIKRELTQAEIQNLLFDGTAAISGPSVICPGGSATLTASGGLSYLWDDNSTNPSRVINQPGNYSVTIFRSSTCSQTLSQVVTEYVPPITITANGPTSFCEGGSVTLSAPASTPVIWNDGNTDNPRVVSQSGTYSIQNPGTACPVNSNSINVTVFDNPAQPSTSPSGNVSITEGTSLTITASEANAYEWIPGGQTQSSITVSQAGSYQVRIFDENGCSSLSNAVNVSVTAPPPPPTDGCFAIQVVEYNPKKRNDGSNIPAERTIATRATLEPQGSDATTSEANVNFVSLGFGGSIVLRMSGPIANGEGNDITVFETTFSPNTENCNRYPESVQAFASQDGCNWVYLGEDCQNASFDLGPLDWAEYIKLIDVSPADHPFNNSIADGYDVDGIVCLHGLRENPVPQDLGNLYASTVESFNQGARKNGTAVLLARSNPNNTLGAPQNNNTVNFFSLGFGGSIVLKLGYVAFDKEGSDLHIVETSFGNPSCANYPEKANIEVSLDGVGYTDLGEICVDGSVDFASGGINAVQYVRITDRSMASQFNGSADAYDVDAIVVLQPGCSSTNTDQTKIADNVLTPNEIAQLNGISTIFDEQIQLTIETAEINEVIQIQIVGIDGKVLINEGIQAGSSTLINQIYSLKGMSSGIYIVRGSSPSGSFTNKVFKP